MIKYSLFFAFLTFLGACSKDFLKANPSSENQITQNLNQLARLFNNTELMNVTPVLGEQSSDDYYLKPEYYNKLFQLDQNVYTWQKDLFAGSVNIVDWNMPYAQVNTCNVVIEELSKITRTVVNRQQWNEIKGTALFMRSYAFFNIAQLFASPYDEQKADDQLGIVLPLAAGVESVPPRSTMRQTYKQIIQDLEAASILLPGKVSGRSINLPNKPAAFALLARVCLSISDIVSAGKYADSCLAYYSTLIDYNTLPFGNKYLFSELNEETIFQSRLISGNIIQAKIISGAVIDSSLYALYESNDLRKKVFFTLNAGHPIFNNSYTGKTHPFSGLAVDEVLLIRAEVNARQGHIEKAMADINKLVKNRYKTGSDTLYQARSRKEALAIVLKERRKELVFRGLRWTDLRRLNQEEANKIILYRFVNDTLYQLLPNSSRYTLPIPANALDGTRIIPNERD
jgi:hypothetical protein